MAVTSGARSGSRGGARWDGPANIPGAARRDPDEAGAKAEGSVASGLAAAAAPAVEIPPAKLEEFAAIMSEAGIGYGLAAETLGKSLKRYPPRSAQAERFCVFHFKANRRSASALVRIFALLESLKPREE
jgi:hypothetical protein